MNDDWAPDVNPNANTKIYLYEDKQVSTTIDMYRMAIEHPEKAIYWKFTLEFGRMYEKMQREWCDYCIEQLEGLKRMQDTKKK